MTTKNPLEIDLSEILKRCCGGIFLILSFLLKWRSLISTAQTQTQVWTLPVFPMLSDILELLNLKIHLHGRFKARIRLANLHSVFPPARQTTQGLWDMSGEPRLLTSYWTCEVLLGAEEVPLLSRKQLFCPTLWKKSPRVPQHFCCVKHNVLHWVSPEIIKTGV